jgi:hypothetical protein
MIYFSLVLNNLCVKLILSVLFNRILYVFSIDILLLVGMHLLLNSSNLHVSMHSFVDLSSYGLISGQELLLFKQTKSKYKS